MKEKEVLKLLRNLLEEVTSKYDELVEKKDEKMRELFSAATKDPLTELYNRHYFIDFLKKAVSRVSREQEFGKKLALIFIDLDRFKRVNDLYGHEVGDRILKETAQFLKENVRDSDVIARYGGDEFLLLFEGKDIDHQTLENRLLELKERFEERFKEFDISISYGAAIFPDELSLEKDIDDIIKTMINIADIRMYEHKRRKRREGWSAQSLSGERQEKE